MMLEKLSAIGEKIAHHFDGLKTHLNFGAKPNESIETLSFNKKCVKRRNNKMLHLSATGNVIEVTSFYYRKQYSNQFDKTTPKVKKMDINFKYDAEENLVARLGKAFKHLKQLVVPSSGAPDAKQDHTKEKF